MSTESFTETEISGETAKPIKIQTQEFWQARGKETWAEGRETDVGFSLPKHRVPLSKPV